MSDGPRCPYGHEMNAGAPDFIGDGPGECRTYYCQTCADEARADGMDVEVRDMGNHCWSVFVNGLLMVDREAYPLVMNIADELRYPGSQYTESREVADSIRKYWAENAKGEVDAGAAALRENEALRKDRDTLIAALRSMGARVEALEGALDKTERETIDVEIQKIAREVKP